MNASVKAGRESRMQEPHEKGRANHLDPESCADAGTETTLIQTYARLT